METILEAASEGVNFDKNDPAKKLLQLIDVVREAVENISQDGNGQVSGLEIYLDLLDGILPKGWLSSDNKKTSNRLGIFWLKKVK